MEVFIIDILHAGFVFLLHLAGAVARNVRSSIGNLAGMMSFSSIRSESKLSVLHYESLTNKF